MEKEKALQNKEAQKIADEIVVKWNKIVKNFQNTTIKLCLMIQNMLKDYPNETIKDILKRVRKHPDIKKFVSIGRIWQGMRLIRNRSDLIKYHTMDEDERKELSKDDKPYLKDDGEIFWEFYFELAKQPLSDQTLTMLELEGKKEGWSYRELKQKISEVKQENLEPGAYEVKKKVKGELMKKINGICKELKVKQINKILNLCEKLKNGNQNKEEDK